jgi:hypothetical protein
VTGLNKPPDVLSVSPVIVIGGIGGGLIAELHVSVAGAELAPSRRVTVKENGPEDGGVPELLSVVDAPVALDSASHDGAVKLQLYGARPPDAPSGTDTLTGRLKDDAGHVPLICSGGTCTVIGQLSDAGVEPIASLSVTLKL